MLLGQFVVLLLVIELCLRLFYPVPFRRPLSDLPENVWTQVLHRKSTQPGLSYELVPNSHGEHSGAVISVNSLGFRGKEVSVVKPPDTLRIVSMGASIGFGWTVDNDHTYPADLERILNEKVHDGERHYEVLNYGVGGYATRDEVATLEDKALAMDPDLVIIDYHPNGPESEPVQPLHQVFHQPLWWEHWNLLRLLAYGKRWWGIQTLGHGEQYRFLAAPKGPHWPTLLKAFDKARELCDARGIKVIIAVWPTYSQRVPWDQYRFFDLRDQVVEAAHERGFTTVDMLPVFTASGYTMDQIAADAEHPNQLGLELAAQELAKVILQHHQELLKVPPP
jgi:lysophospholipase L1-like esterase